MAKSHKPRAGSLQFWPRVRAKRIYSKIRTKPDTNIHGFAGYKAGMTHISVTDTEQHSITKGKTVTSPVTIIECPPLKPFSLRFYQQTPYGPHVLTEIPSKILDKNLLKKVKGFSKKQEVPENYDYLTLTVYTQPKLTGLAKKRPEIFEIPLNVSNVDEAKAFLEKELKLSDIFKAGQYVDIHAITKGKGFQGPVKRFGITLKSHKSEKKRRSPGNLGPFTPRKTSWKVPQHGQHGYHTRTEYNKSILYVGNDVSKINQKGGIKQYGNVKNEYLLIKGSVAGTAKRLILFSNTVRKIKDVSAPEVQYISQESKQ